MNENDLVSWLNSRSSSSISTIREAQSGIEVCSFLILITGSPQFEKKITNGRTKEEKARNFEIAKEIFGSIGLSFDFSIPKLINGDKNELISLIKCIQSLEDEEQPMSDHEEEGDYLDIDLLIADLEENLNQKLEDSKHFAKEIEELASEREFYLDKLLRVEKIAEKHPPSDSEAVIKILKLTSGDFQPCEE